MAKLKTDSPLCRRIVLAFLDFLNSVEPNSGVDLEGLEVAKECLSEAFNIDLLSVNRAPKSDSLVDIFSSLVATEQHETKSDINHERFPANAPSTSSAHIDSTIAKASHSLDEDWIKETQNLGIRDELFGQFFGALEKIHYFGTSPDGHDDQVQLDRATSLFHNALMEMKKSGHEKFDQKNLAETFKVQGNKAMQSKLYPDAIEFYTIAIALCDDNAVYYCNRAAGYTQMNQYTEAIRDCYKSIEIDPNYSKAYSRLGFAYYAQGNYRDSIDKGFMKALQLDPNNDSVKENIQAAEQKLHQQRTGHNQNSSSASHSNQHSAGESRSHASPTPFTSMPFSVNGIPVDMASMLRNMAGNVYQGGQQGQPGPEGGGNTNAEETLDEPEIRIGGNITVNLGDQIPEDLSGALRSVMDMLSGGAASNGNSQDNLNGRSAPS